MRSFWALLQVRGPRGKEAELVATTRRKRPEDLQCSKGMQRSRVAGSCQEGIWTRSVEFEWAASIPSPLADKQINLHLREVDVFCLRT